MNQSDRLALRISSALNGKAEGFEARALASQYATLVESTRERLHQCVALIRAGNEHTALQIAESEPPVLDMAAKLAFADSSRWLAWCKSAGLPAPAPLEDHLIELVNSLYSKTIDQTHPLYKEYRAAVRERDDLRALTVLRSITRVNAADSNAREEYERLSSKVRRELLAGMKAALVNNQTEEVFDHMTKLETSGLGPFDDNADWRDAAKAVEAWERAKMKAEALLCIPPLLKLREESEWESCIPLLAKVQSLRQQYGFTIRPEEAQLFDEIESWVMEHSAVAEKERREREEIAALLLRADALLRRGVEPLSPKDTTGLIDEMKTWLSESEAAPASEQVNDAVNQTRRALENLASERARFIRRKRVKIALAAGGTLAFCAIGGAITLATLRTGEFSSALASAENETRIHPVETFLTGQVPAYPDLAEKADFKPRIENLKNRVKKTSVELSEILDAARSIEKEIGRSGVATRGLPEKITALEKRVSALPSDIRDEAQRELKRAAQALSGARKAAANKALADVRATKTALDTLLLAPESAESMKDWPAAAAALATALTNRDITDDESVLAAKETLARARTTFPGVAAKIALEREIGESRTLETHLAAAATAAKATIESPEIQAVKRVNDAAKDLRKLPAPLISKEAAAMLPHAIPGTRFTAGEASALEASDATRITAECAKNTDLWRLPIARTDADGTGSNSLAIFKGRPEIITYALTNGEETRTRGERVKADGSTEPVAYTYRRFEGHPGIGNCPGVPSRSPESELFIAGSKFYDSDRGTFLESPIAFADRVYANRVASPLAKARLLMELRSILQARPEARGLAFVPELRDELESLSKICGATPPAGAWLTPERYGDILPNLVRHFEVKRPSYAAYADFRVRLLRASIDSGCIYAGSCNASGAPVLRSPAPPKGVRLLGLDESGKAAVIGVMGDAGAINTTAPACPYSPILILAKSPGEIAAGLPGKVKPEAPSGDWTNLILPTP